MTDPRGFAPGADRRSFTTSYEYDREDRQILVRQPGKAQPWQTDYDEKGRIKTVTDPLSNKTIYDFDEADRLHVVKSRAAT